MREQNVQEGRRTEREREERDNLIVGASKGLIRNMDLGKFPGIHQDDSS